MKKQLKIINKLFLIIKEIFYGIKSLLFKNKDIISGEEIVEYTKNKIINDENFEKLLKIKKFRKLNNIYYVWDYNDYFKKLIFNYKYKRKKKISKLIAELIYKEFYYVLEKEKIDIVISVPINKKRKSERGFNQVDEILKTFNFGTQERYPKLKIKYVEIERIKNTKKMHKILDEELRKENVKGSFTINKKIDLANKNILLVDDIITTGATLKEIKNSILQNIKLKNTNIVVFCLAAAREIKENKGEI